MNFPVEISITRLANEELRPVRITLAVPGSPKERIVVALSLEDLALAITGRGAVPAILTKNAINAH